MAEGYSLPLISHLPSLICCYVINNLVLNILVKKIAPFALEFTHFLSAKVDFTPINKG